MEKKVYDYLDYRDFHSGKDGSAFVPEVLAAGENQSDITVAIGKAGSISGEISNALEIHNSGSIVVHLLSTDIYRNIDNNGKFVIDNVPTGIHTLVSYATNPPDFFPDYRSVTVRSDSASVLTAVSAPPSSTARTQGRAIFWINAAYHLLSVNLY
jgi:hypothetical protein